MKKLLSFLLVGLLVLGLVGCESGKASALSEEKFRQVMKDHGIELKSNTEEMKELFDSEVLRGSTRLFKINDPRLSPRGHPLKQPDQGGLCVLTLYHEHAGKDKADENHTV